MWSDFIMSRISSYNDGNFQTNVMFSVNYLHVSSALEELFSSFMDINHIGKE